MAKTYFNPGCALSIYKPEAEEKLLKFLNEHHGGCRIILTGTDMPV